MDKQPAKNVRNRCEHTCGMCKGWYGWALALGEGKGTSQDAGDAGTLKRVVAIVSMIQ